MSGSGTGTPVTPVPGPIPGDFDDLTPFFNTDDFAIAATVGLTTVPVIFDAAYLESLGVAGTNPVALAKASDSAAAVGATIVISGTSYTIRNREPQDDGATVLLQLEKV